MINSRSLDDLLPQVKQRVEAFIKAADASGIDLLVTSTYRDNESQNALYAQGRTTAGRVVTNAKAGQSFHNYRCAVDVVPLVNGKPAWNVKDEVWQTIGKLRNIGKAPTNDRSNFHRATVNRRPEGLAASCGNPRLG